MLNLPGQGFLYMPQSQQVHAFEATPHGSDWTVQLETPNNAHRRVVEALEQTRMEEDLQSELSRCEPCIPHGVPEKVRQAICAASFPGPAFRP